VTSKAVDSLNALSAQGLVQKPTPPPQALNLTLTTTGTSGASTLVGTTLNIPIYAGGGSSNLTVYSSTGSSGTLSSIGTSIQTFNKVLALTSSTVTAAGTILRVRGSIQVSNGAATPYSLFVLVGVFPTSSAYVEMAYPFYVAPSVSGAVITVDLECKCQSVGTSSVIYVNGLATMAQGSGAGVQQTFPIGGTLTTNVSTWSSQSLALGVAANVASSLSATLYDVTYSIITPTGTI
jgi:hypothetical protein